MYAILVTIALGFSIWSDVLTTSNNNTLNDQRDKLNDIQAETETAESVCNQAFDILVNTAECIKCNGNDAIVEGDLNVTGTARVDAVIVGTPPTTKRSLAEDVKFVVYGSGLIRGSISVDGEGHLTHATASVVQSPVVIVNNGMGTINVGEEIKYLLGKVPPTTCYSEWDHSILYSANDIVVYGQAIWQTSHSSLNDTPSNSSLVWSPICSHIDESFNCTGPPGNDGLSAITTTTASYVQPATNGTVAISVASSFLFLVGQNVFVEGGGYYLIQSKSSNTSMTLINLGSPDNVAENTTVTSSSSVGPSGGTQIACTLPYCSSTTNFAYGGALSANATAQTLICDSMSASNPCNNRTTLTNMASANAQSSLAPIALNTTFTSTVSGVYNAYASVQFSFPAGSGPWNPELIFTVDGVDVATGQTTYLTGVTRGVLNLPLTYYIASGSILVPYINVNAPTATGTVSIGTSVATTFNVQPAW